MSTPLGPRISAGSQFRGLTQIEAAKKALMSACTLDNGDIVRNKLRGFRLAALLAQLEKVVASHLLEGVRDCLVAQ